MFSFLRKNSNKSPEKKNQEQPEVKTEAKPWSRGLERTRRGLTDHLRQLWQRKRYIDEAFIQDVKRQLLLSDMGPATTEHVLDQLKKEAKKQGIQQPEALFSVLKDVLYDLIAPYAKPFVVDSNHQPYVVLMVGVNGSGKTTTLGKLTSHLKQKGLSILLAAGDTFRAAAVEQLQVWAERNQTPLIAQKQGSDSAAVIFDALSAAKARHIDVLLADTAGRLHNKAHLMSELKKLKRVLRKQEETAPHEVLLVIDAACGQSALLQAEQFIEAIGVTGIVLTKLDSTAKGGIIFAVANQFNLPIRFIGLGEKIEDLQPFDAIQFVEALFET